LRAPPPPELRPCVCAAAHKPALSLASLAPAAQSHIASPRLPHSTLYCAAPAPQDLFELLGLAKYNGTGRFHWGKNTDRTFTDPRFPTRPRYPAFDKMLELQARFDPDKVFEPPLFAKVAAERPYTHFPGCALSYECFCTEDAHCNLPGRQVDFKCLESSAFPEFKVCKGPADWDPTLLARYGKGIWVKRTDASPLLKLAGGVSDQLMRHPVTAGLLTASSSLMSSLPMLPVLGHRK
jgi:hypothetical protein